MTKDADKLRHGPKIYHDLVFEEEIKDLINTTKKNYDGYALCSLSTCFLTLPAGCSTKMR